MKRQPSEWEKIFANEATDKGFISKIYKQFIYSSVSENKELSQKMGRRLKRNFSRKNIQMANKHMKRCSTSLIIREMQIKTTMRYHLTPIRMAIIKNLQTINAGEDGGKGNPPALFVRMYTDRVTIENSMEIPFKTRNKITI